MGKSFSFPSHLPYVNRKPVKPSTILPHPTGLVVHVVKDTFGQNTIDTIIEKIENTFKEIPYKLPDSLSDNLTLALFTDTFYDDRGYKRVSFIERYGNFYIIELFDYKLNAWYYIAYSMYDIFEYYNRISSSNVKTVPYINLVTSKSRSLKFTVSLVKNPTIYKDHPSLTEINKYKIDFNYRDDESKYGSVDVELTQTTFTVSNLFTDIDSVKVGNRNINGALILKIGSNKITVPYSFESNDIDNTEFSDLLSEIRENEKYEEYFDIAIGDHERIDRWTDSKENEYLADLSDAETTEGIHDLEAVIVKYTDDPDPDSEPDDFVHNDSGGTEGDENHDDSGNSSNENETENSNEHDSGNESGNSDDQSNESTAESGSGSNEGESEGSNQNEENTNKEDESGTDDDESGNADSNEVEPSSGKDLQPYVSVNLHLTNCHLKDHDYANKIEIERDLDFVGIIEADTNDYRIDGKIDVKIDNEPISIEDADLENSYVININHELFENANTIDISVSAIEYTNSSIDQDNDESL